MRISLLAILGLVVCPMMGWAETPEQFDRTGFYLGAGGLYAIENFDTASGVSADNAPGFNFRLGYRITPYIAVEAMGERVDKFDLNNAVGLSIDTWVGTVNGKVFALTNQIQPYGLFGLGAMRSHSKIRSGFNVDSTATDLAVRFGGGIDLYVNDCWVVNPEISYVLPRGDVRDVDYISLGIGIQHRF